MAQALLDVRNLSVDYNGCPAVSDVSFSVAPAQVVGIVGESGCGKTSLVSSLVAALPPSGSVRHGQVLFEGRDLLAMDAKALCPLLGARISMVFQNPQAAFNPVRTMEAQFVQTIRAHTDVSRDQARRMSLEALRAMDLEDPQRVLASRSFELSGGMCQRAALALAMVLRPSLIIADEPTSALDVIAQNCVIEEMKGLNRRYQTAFILVSHNMGVVFAVAQTVCVMYAGRVVETGSVADIAHHPMHPYTKALMDSMPQLGRKTLPGIPGMPPVLGQAVKGCAFAPRCCHASDKCFAERADFRNLGEGRGFACWKAQAQLAHKAAVE